MLRQIKIEIIYEEFELSPIYSVGIVFPFEYSRLEHYNDEEEEEESR